MFVHNTTMLSVSEHLYELQEESNMQRKFDQINQKERKKHTSVAFLIIKTA